MPFRPLTDCAVRLAFDTSVCKTLQRNRTINDNLKYLTLRYLQFGFTSSLYCSVSAGGLRFYKVLKPLSISAVRGGPKFGAGWRFYNPRGASANKRIAFMTAGTTPDLSPPVRLIPADKMPSGIQGEVSQIRAQIGSALG